MTYSATSSWNNEKYFKRQNINNTCNLTLSDRLKVLTSIYTMYDYSATQLHSTYLYWFKVYTEVIFIPSSLNSIILSKSLFISTYSDLAADRTFCRSLSAWTLTDDPMSIGQPLSSASWNRRTVSNCVLRWWHGTQSRRTSCDAWSFNEVGKNLQIQTDCFIN
jgi:hypothetical protein